jgi:Pilus assembly protein, PilO
VSPRQRILTAIAGALVVLGGFWFLALSPRFDKASELSDQVAKAQTRLTQAEAEAVSAQEAKKAYRRNYATVARLGKSVPVDDDVPSLVYQLDQAANATKVDFRTIKLGSAQSAAASQPAPKSGTATQTAAATLPPGSSIGPAGFPSMPFSFTFKGNFFTLERFLRKLDSFTGVSGKHIRVGGRLLTLNGISLSAATEGFPHIKASISATAFLVPADEGLTGGATPATPASTTTTAAEVTP